MLKGYGGKPANDGEYEICFKRIKNLNQFLRIICI